MVCRWSTLFFLSCKHVVFQWSASESTTMLLSFNHSLRNSCIWFLLFISLGPLALHVVQDCIFDLLFAAWLLILSFASCLFPFRSEWIVQQRQYSCFLICDGGLFTVSSLCLRFSQTPWVVCFWVHGFHFSVSFLVSLLWEKKLAKLFLVCLSRKYTEISSQEQRQSYKNDFNAEYSEYRALHARIEGITRQFTVLDAELKQLQQGTDQYKVIIIQTRLHPLHISLLLHIRTLWHISWLTCAGAMYTTARWLYNHPWPQRTQISCVYP